MMTARMLVIIGGIVVTTAACQEPVEPGSDLPQQTSGPNLGPNIDVGLIGDVEAAAGADISGRFTLTAEVRSSRGGQSIPFGFLAVAEQSGMIDSGAATVTLELRNPGSPEMEGPTSMAAPVASSGSFEATVEGYPVDAESSEFLTADAAADVTLEAQIVDDDCFIGDASVYFEEAEVQGAPQPVEDLTLEGPFTAERQGSAGCGGGTSGDAGSDANMGGG